MNALVKYFFLLLSIFLLNTTQAQHCSVVITGPEVFHMTINNKPVHPQPVNRIKINQLQTENKYVAELIYKSDSTRIKTTLFLFEQDFVHFYEADKEGIRLKKIQPDLTFEPDEKILNIYWKEGNAIQTEPDTIPADTLIADTAYKPPFEHYYHLEDYNGRIGCPWPIPEEKVAEIKNLLLNEPLEERKLEKAKTAFMQMDSLCILMEDVKTLAALFEYEETRLQFAKFLAPNFFDIDQVGKLEEVFNFENSMDEIKAYIGTQIAKPEKN
ncbi:MAG: DUF4476 domain-containing protein [Flavobacteriales bacterium]|nr:DUF4476 domain-containing protein [Flavobacteriales bacterium]